MKLNKAIMRPYSAIQSYETAYSEFIDVTDHCYEEVDGPPQLLFPDNRSKVDEKKLLQYPYNCIGLVVSYF